MGQKRWAQGACAVYSQLHTCQIGSLHNQNFSFCNGCCAQPSLLKEIQRPGNTRVLVKTTADKNTDAVTSKSNLSKRSYAKIQLLSQLLTQNFLYTHLCAMRMGQTSSACLHRSVPPAFPPCHAVSIRQTKGFSTEFKCYVPRAARFHS